MLKLKMSNKGEIVIPKKVREQIGLVKESIIILEVKGRSIELKAGEEIDVVKDCEERAKRTKVDVSKWIYGDKLYEEVF